MEPPPLPTTGATATPVAASSSIPSEAEARTPVSAPPSLSTRSTSSVKRGYRPPATNSAVCAVAFETIPIWLWTLRLCDWRTIYITKASHTLLCESYPTTASRFNDLLTLVAKLDEVESSALRLLSGSLSFLEVHHTSMSPTVCWWPKCGRKPRHSFSGQWFWKSHFQVGGVTSARGFFGVSGLPPLTLPNCLMRALRHIIKYSERPKPCDAVPEFDHYKEDDRLDLHRLETPVVYSTYMVRTGWGFRLLLPEEKCSAFDLPSWLPWADELVQTALPLKLFQVILDTLLEEIQGNSAPSLSMKRQKIRPVPDDVTWLPTCCTAVDPTWQLHRYLAPSWADQSVVSVKAVKSEDAAVAYQLWNQRINLVLPCQTVHLQRLQRFAMQRWRYNLVRSLFNYLRHEHGQNWMARLQRAHASVASRPTKRARLGTPLVNREQGGLRELKDLSAKEQLQELFLDVSKGLKVLGQVLRSTWWEWNTGSSLFFWRWNGLEQRQAARDGMRIFVTGTLPRNPPNKSAYTPEQKPIIAEKFDKIIVRGYVSDGPIYNFLNCFPVKKGLWDWRLVYDGTQCGLNDVLWAPNFYLPDAQAAGRLLTYSSYCADIDFGEMFLNFFMDESLRPFAGLDVSPVREFLKSLPEGERLACWKRWNRLFMGMTPSPYCVVRHYYWLEEFVRGDPRNKQNPMRYDCVRMNLPVTEGYDPTLPKLMKWNEDAKAIAGDIATFMDDGRINGHSRENAWQVKRRFSSRAQYLGAQDAPRKCRPPSQKPGAWIGTVFEVKPKEVTLATTQDKWDKFRSIIVGWVKVFAESPSESPEFVHKTLEKEAGFVNHLGMTYRDFVPFTKGLYLTLNIWRKGRDAEGWKIPDSRWAAHLFASHQRGEMSEQELELGLGARRDEATPRTVRAAERMRSDVQALDQLSRMATPPVVSVLAATILFVVYGFADASGTGLGAAFTCGEGFSYRVGVWSEDDSGESSNWREFDNCVGSLEDEGEAGHITGAEVYLFTDNSTVEAAVHKGSSSSPKLLGLVIRLKVLAQKYSVKIHVFHVAGLRMIASGIDGISRGALTEGVMAGKLMTDFIPIHLSALTRSPKLLPWIQSWAGENVIPLDPIDWFERGHDIKGWGKSGFDNFERPVLTQGDVYLWTPAPIVAEVAIGELRIARLKRQTSTHIFVCPRLCSPLFLSKLYKAADVVFEVPAGSEAWGKEQYEPLLIGVLFPFIRAKPWQLRGTPKMLSVARELREVFNDQEVDPRDLLRELLLLGRRLRTMPENVVRALLFLR